MHLPIGLTLTAMLGLSFEADPFRSAHQAPRRQIPTSFSNSSVFGSTGGTVISNRPTFFLLTNSASNTSLSRSVVSSYLGLGSVTLFLTGDVTTPTMISISLGSNSTIPASNDTASTTGVIEPSNMLSTTYSKSFLSFMNSTSLSQIPTSSNLLNASVGSTASIAVLRSTAPSLQRNSSSTIRANGLQAASTSNGHPSVFSPTSTASNTFSSVVWPLTFVSASYLGISGSSEGSSRTSFTVLVPGSSGNWSKAMLPTGSSTNTPSRMPLLTPSSISSTSLQGHPPNTTRFSEQLSSWIPSSSSIYGLPAITTSVYWNTTLSPPSTPSTSSITFKLSGGGILPVQATVQFSIPSMGPSAFSSAQASMSQLLTISLQNLSVPFSTSSTSSQFASQIPCVLLRRAISPLLGCMDETTMPLITASPVMEETSSSAATYYLAISSTTNRKYLNSTIAITGSFSPSPLTQDTFASVLMNTFSSSITSEVSLVTSTSAINRGSSIMSLLSISVSSSTNSLLSPATNGTEYTTTPSLSFSSMVVSLGGSFVPSETPPRSSLALSTPYFIPPTFPSILPNVTLPLASTSSSTTMTGTTILSLASGNLTLSTATSLSSGGAPRIPTLSLLTNSQSNNTTISSTNSSIVLVTSSLSASVPVESSVSYSLSGSSTAPPVQLSSGLYITPLPLHTAISQTLSAPSLEYPESTIETASSPTLPSFVVSSVNSMTIRASNSTTALIPSSIHASQSQAASSSQVESSTSSGLLNFLAGSNGGLPAEGSTIVTSVSTGSPSDVTLTATPSASTVPTSHRARAAHAGFEALWLVLGVALTSLVL